ncbi:MAG: fibronectin type III domain-containing protein [Flavobacteriaceae bacterium]
MKKYIAAILLFSLFFACSSDGDSPVVKATKLSTFNIHLQETTLTSASIKWDAVTVSDGSSVTYDIYLNNKIDLDYSNVALNYTSTSYNFTDLTSGVDYFVKIIAKNEEGVVEEKTSTFTTITNEKPTKFTAAIENIEAFSASLSWIEATDPEGTAVTYDIYLNNNLLVENLTGLTYDLTDLEEETYYTVTVAAKDADGYQREVVTEFTTPKYVAILGSYSENNSGTITAKGNLNSGTLIYYGGSKTEFDIYLYDEETGNRFYFYLRAVDGTYNFEEQEFVTGGTYRVVEASYKDSSSEYWDWGFGSVKLNLKRNTDNTYSISFSFQTNYYGSEPVADYADLTGSFQGALTFDDQS